jgi:hypothetical protein
MLKCTAAFPTRDAMWVRCYGHADGTTDGAVGRNKRLPAIPEFTSI